MTANLYDTPPSKQNFTEDFWLFLDQLVAESDIIIDRSRGSANSDVAQMVYPCDYGHLAQTTAESGCGINVWVGSLADRCLDAALLTLDLKKSAAEIELMIGCTAAEKQIILNFSNGNSISSVPIQRGGEIEWLRTRRSIRHFRPQEIPDDVLRRVLETTIWAPSAHNRQPWRFAVLRSYEARKKMADAMGASFQQDLAADGIQSAEIEAQLTRSYTRILNAPVAIVLCLDLSQGDSYPDPTRQQAEYLMGVQSVALAGGYLLLAAHAVGLAGVWVCAPLFASNAVHQALHLSEHWQPQALILLGYPDRPGRPRSRKPLDEVTVYV